MITKRILIIDDNIHVREVVATCLRKLGGWEVTSTSGSEGILKAQTEKFDAVVLNMMTLDQFAVGMNELMFLEQLQSGFSSLPVVLLSANISLENKIIFSDLGVVIEISNPFDPTVLVQQIARAMNWDLSKITLLATK